MRRALCLGAPTLLAWLLASPALASVNSYRFLHVTIDTPWHIFLFLLMGIFAPFILMVVLMWRNSLRKRAQPEAQPDVPDSSKPPQS
ncbi:exported hypothetical protein [Burkholderiales bacterium]|jgi:hypothetical protein|nr:exported hypothetical protein [Burkholderiales bacterium]